MKNLHKKISAVLLAGMVVFGGVVASGVSSFAASKVAKANVKQEDYQVKRVKNIVKNYGAKVVKSSSDSKEIDQSARKEYSNKKYQKRCGSDVKNPYKIPLNLSNGKRYGFNLIKVLCNGIYYLIELN